MEILSSEFIVFFASPNQWISPVRSLQKRAHANFGHNSARKLNRRV